MIDQRDDGRAPRGAEDEAANPVSQRSGRGADRERSVMTRVRLAAADMERVERDRAKAQTDLGRPVAFAAVLRALIVAALGAGSCRKLAAEYSDLDPVLQRFGRSAGRERSVMTRVRLAAADRKRVQRVRAKAQADLRRPVAFAAVLRALIVAALGDASRRELAAEHLDTDPVRRGRPKKGSSPAPSAHQEAAELPRMEEP